MKIVSEGNKYKPKAGAMYLLEFEFPDRRQRDRYIALSLSEAQDRAHKVVDDGTARAVRLFPLKQGRPFVIRKEASK